MILRVLAVLCLFGSSLFLCSAQQLPASPQAVLTLEQAESIALTNQPRLLAAQLRARASSERIRQARSGLLPTVQFNATGVLVADTGTATAAGNITTSSISDHFAYGGNLSQLVTDFGRTSALVRSTRETAAAQANLVTLTKAQVRLNVREAYFRVLGAEAVLRAAKAAQANRQLVSRQLNALSQSELRSTLDVDFAKVLESEADLAVVRAVSGVGQERVHLATAMGASQSVSASLADIAPGGDALPPSPDDLQHQAIAQRADLGAAQSTEKASKDFALSEKKLSYPSLNVLGAAGQIPYHDHTLRDDYAAAGFNLNIPIFNGNLFAARRAEAELESQARSRDTQELRLQVTEEVRNAWYRAEEAFQSLDVMARLVAQSKEALRLAQDRYQAGLGSIVELNEAQLNETSAEISEADANYTYLARRTELDFEAGLLN